MTFWVIYSRSSVLCLYLQSCRLSPLCVGCKTESYALLFYNVAKLWFCVTGERFRVHIRRSVTKVFFRCFYDTPCNLCWMRATAIELYFHIHFEATHSEVCQSVQKLRGRQPFSIWNRYGNAPSFAATFLFCLFFLNILTFSNISTDDLRRRVTVQKISHVISGKPP